MEQSAPPHDEPRRRTRGANLAAGKRHSETISVGATTATPAEPVAGWNHVPASRTVFVFTLSCSVSLRRGPPSVKRGDERGFDHRMRGGEGKCPQTRLWAQTSDGDTERGRSL